MTSKQNKGRSKKKTTADAAVFCFEERGERSNAAPSAHHPPKGGERSNAAARTAVCRRTTVTRAPRSRARLRVVTTRRRPVAQPRTPHLHCAARAVLRATAPQCKFSLGGCKGGVSLFQKEIPLPLSASPASMQEDYQLLRSRKFRCFPESLWQHKPRSRMRARENA